jgi:hypothetical protein
MKTDNKDKDIGPLPDYAQGVQGPYAAGHRESLWRREIHWDLPLVLY